jgi:hypothetical protein
MRPPLLTPQEQENLRMAILRLHAQTGSWRTVARAIRSERTNLRRLQVGNRIRGMGALARRVARVVGVPEDDLLAGKFPPPGTCRTLRTHHRLM